MLWRVSSRSRRTLPIGFIQPCLAVEADEVPSAAGWAHEIKHDGYRMQLRIADGRIRLFTRRGFDWTARYSWVVDSAKALRVKSATMDGELVCVGKDGVADFSKLHSRCHDGEAFLYAFDLIEHNGENLRGQSLAERKRRLETLIKRAPAGIRFVDHDDGDGSRLFKAACRMGLEGIVSKRLDSRYRSGRCKFWVKVKNPKSASVLRVRDGLEG